MLHQLGEHHEVDICTSVYGLADDPIRAPGAGVRRRLARGRVHHLAVFAVRKIIVTGSMCCINQENTMSLFSYCVKAAITAACARSVALATVEAIAASRQAPIPPAPIPQEPPMEAVLRSRRAAPANIFPLPRETSWSDQF